MGPAAWFLILLLGGSWAAIGITGTLDGHPWAWAVLPGASIVVVLFMAGMEALFKWDEQWRRRKE